MKMNRELTSVPETIQLTTCLLHVLRQRHANPDDSRPNRHDQPCHNRGHFPLPDLDVPVGMRSTVRRTNLLACVSFLSPLLIGRRRLGVRRFLTELQFASATEERSQGSQCFFRGETGRMNGEGTGLTMGSASVRIAVSHGNSPLGTGKGYYRGNQDRQRVPFHRSALAVFCYLDTYNSN